MRHLNPTEKNIQKLANDLAFWYRYAPEGATHALATGGVSIKWLRWTDGGVWQVYMTHRHQEPLDPACFEHRENHLITKPPEPDIAPGRRVRYIADTTRKGWEGTIDKVEIDLDRVRVHYDNNVKQWYSIAALTGAPRFYDEEGEPVCERYLELLCEEQEPIGAPALPEDSTLYLVRGARGGPVAEFEDRGVAEIHSQKKAQESKSGQAYRIYKAVGEYQRTDPPVEYRRLDQ